MSADGGKTATIEGRAPAPETRVPAAPPAPPVAPAPARNYRRYVLMASVPVVLAAIGGYWYLTGGRYVSTDDAYVQQDRVTIAPQVSGRIVTTMHRENDKVLAGDVLFVIDPEPYRIALAAADSGLATARLAVEQLRSSYQQAIASEQAATDEVAFQQKAFDRQQGLLGKGVATQAAYDTAENAVHNAQQALVQTRQKTASALAALGGNAAIATDDHPTVRAAMAKRDQAALDLKNTTVLSPSAGVVAQADRLLVGQQVGPGLAVLSLVETDESWVEANFKETDVGRMVTGEPVTVTLDAYPGHTLTGVVASIGAGTGSEFSLLPAQNATGNWVKVVQRVPVNVRITSPLDGLALRTGLSASVSVDTQAPAAAAK
jgi:membrane fusion protein (multidrug efflux system)